MIKLEQMKELEAPTYDNTFQGLVRYSGLYSHDGFRAVLFRMVPKQIAN